MNWTFGQMVVIVLIGLAGGTLGGLLGLGGSVFIIPTLTLVLGTNQHLYQASALVANVFVAGAATMRHRGRGTIQMDIVPMMAASSSIAALVGVWASNKLDPKPLAAMFGIFLCYAASAECIRLVRSDAEHAPALVDRPRILLGGCIGLVGGFASGLLGIGGGAIMVPLLRRFGKLTIRQAVASAAAAMIAACSIGAIAKNAAVSGLQDAQGNALSLQMALFLAALLSPTAMLGGSFGAALVYRMPIFAIRLVLSALLAFAGVRMILTGGSELRNMLMSVVN